MASTLSSGFSSLPSPPTAAYNLFILTIPPSSASVIDIKTWLLTWQHGSSKQLKTTAASTSAEGILKSNLKSAHFDLNGLSIRELTQKGIEWKLRECFDAEIASAIAGDIERAKEIEISMKRTTSTLDTKLPLITFVTWKHVLFICLLWAFFGSAFYLPYILEVAGEQMSDELAWEFCKYLAIALCALCGMLVVL